MSGTCWSFTYTHYLIGSEVQVFEKISSSGLSLRLGKIRVPSSVYHTHIFVVVALMAPHVFSAMWTLNFNYEVEKFPFNFNVVLKAFFRTTSQIFTISSLLFFSKSIGKFLLRKPLWSEVAVFRKHVVDLSSSPWFNRKQQQNYCLFSSVNTIVNIVRFISHVLNGRLSACDAFTTFCK